MDIYAQFVERWSQGERDAFFDSHPYFVRLIHCNVDRAAFHASQVEFLPAIQAWPTHFAKAFMDTTNLAVRRILLENMVDETGQQDSEAHTETFKAHLALIHPDASADSCLEIRTDCAATFNEAIRSIEGTQDLLLVLGAIEYIYTDISERLATFTKKLTGVASPHYVTHEVLDVHHAQQLCLAASYLTFLPDEECDDRTKTIHQTFDLAVELMRDLYMGLDDTICLRLSPLLFGNVYEDSNVEMDALAELSPGMMQVMCIASAGDTVVDLINNDYKVIVDAVDVNPRQLDYAKCRVFNNIDEILNYLDDSKYISENHISNLREDAEKLGLDVDKICRETDASRTMEGIYIKVFHDHDF